jgi:hypothetical protein
MGHLEIFFSRTRGLEELKFTWNLLDLVQIKFFRYLTYPPWGRMGSQTWKLFLHDFICGKSLKMSLTPYMADTHFYVSLVNLATW